MCCTQAITRILLTVANVLFLLVGVALMAVGIFYLIDYNKITDAIPTEYDALEHIPIISIVVGSIIFIIAFLGCCGTLRSNTCMLTTYAVILVVIFLAQVALGIYGLVKINDDADLKSQLENHLPSLFRKFSSNSEVAETINVIQQNFECCGVSGPTWWTSEGLAIPDSCSNDGVLYSQGCAAALVDFVQRSIKVIAIVAIVISVTEILGAVLALCLTNCIRRDKNKGYY